MGEMGTIGEMARQTEEQLEKLHTMIPDSQLHRVRSAPPPKRPEILPSGIDLGESGPPAHRHALPAMSAVREGRKVNLEFSPAPAPDTWWMNLYVSGSSPVPLTLTAVDTAGFTRSGPLAQQSFTTGDEQFDGRYDSASSTPDRARQILEDPETRQRILAMGEIERFTLESRFIRLIRLVDEFSDIEAEALGRTILEMVLLAGHLEEQASVQGP